jgi:hypothetical protein
MTGIKKGSGFGVSASWIQDWRSEVEDKYFIEIDSF